MSEQEQTSSVEKGYVNCTLPSHGAFYKNENGDELLPGGSVQIRKLTVSEQALLQSPGLDVLQRINGIIRNATKLPPKSVTADKLLLTDRQAILIYQRMITFGPRFTFTYRCPACRSTVKHTTDLLEDLVEVTPDELTKSLADDGEELTEPFGVTLPDEKITVECRFLRGEDELEILKRSKRGKMQTIDNTDQSLFIRLALAITKVNGEVWDTRRKEQMVRGMTSSDSLLIEHAIERRETGVDTTVYPTCSTCGYEVSDGIGLPFDREFFRPSLGANGNAAGTSVLPALSRKGVHGTGGQ